MNLKRIAKRNGKQTKKAQYKAQLRKLQEDCGEDINRYRLLKDKLRKTYGYPVTE